MYYFFFVLPQHGTTFFSQEVYPRSDFWHFLTKFWALFEKVAGHTMKWVAGYNPNSPDIFLTSKEYPTTILDVREASKSFNFNIPIFFTPIFVAIFFLWTNPNFFSWNFGWIYNGIFLHLKKRNLILSICVNFKFMYSNQFLS